MKTPNKFFLTRMATLALLCTGYRVNASSVIPLSPSDHIKASAAVFRGTALSQTCFRNNDGLIYTRTSIRVNEPLLGKFPEVLRVMHCGGRIGTEEEYVGLSPRFGVGGEYLLFVARGSDGGLHCTQGSASAIPLTRVSPANVAGNEFATPGQELLDEVRSFAKSNQHPGSDVTDQADSGGITPAATTGMLQGVNSRFLQPDRGEPIPYLIDADSLPSGITLAQATNAVQQALNSWMAVTSLKFKLEGITSFGQGADTITTGDAKLRIQLHDNYSRINSASVLGIGGRASTGSPSPSGWDLGGNVNGNEFRKSTRGYVVLESGSTSLQNLATFTEVLCHEIGHALNMAHSSENSGELDPTLKQAVMYYQAHADGRGATLGAYDPPVIQQAYPPTNTPPYSYNRAMDVTMANGPQPNIPGINEVELRGYDLQTANLTLLTTNALNQNGTFSQAGSVIKYTPTGNFGDQPRLDPAGGSSYDIIYARYSDGTNASPYLTVRVLSYSEDTVAPTDGLPNNWMLASFGNVTPTGNRAGSADFDGDGMKNIDEYRAGMNPTNAASGQRITLMSLTNIQFQAKAYELYELHSSTNLTNWVRAANPILPTTATGSFTDFAVTAPHQFFRIQKVP